MSLQVSSFLLKQNKINMFILWSNLFLWSRPLLHKHHILPNQDEYPNQNDFIQKMLTVWRLVWHADTNEPGRITDITQPLSLRVLLQPMTDVDTQHRCCCAAVVPLLCCCCYWPQHSPQHRNISIIDHLTIYSVKTDINIVNAFHKVLFPYSSITARRVPDICLFLSHPKSPALDVSVNFTNLLHK